MSAEIEALARESKATRKVQAAMVLNYERDAQRAASESSRTRESIDKLAAEVRKATEEVAALKTQVAPMVQSDEARGRALGKVFDRLTRLTWAQAGAMVVAMVAVPVTVWATIMGLTHPGDFGELVIRIVTIVADDQPTPVLPEAP